MSMGDAKTCKGLRGIASTYTGARQFAHHSATRRSNAYDKEYGAREKHVLKARTRKRLVRAVFSVGRCCCDEQGGAGAPRALDFAIAMRTQQVAKLVKLDVAYAQ